MSTQVKHRMSIAEFHDWAEAQSDGRFELVGGEVVRMSPERLRHNVSKAEIWLVLRNALRAAGKHNAVFTDGVHVKTGPETSRGPDCMVAVGPMDGRDMDEKLIDDPLILVEVISPDSEERDTVDKLAEYFRLPTAAHYLVVWPEEATIGHYARIGPGGPYKVLLRPGDRLRLDPPGIEVDVAAMLDAASR